MKLNKTAIQGMREKIREKIENANLLDGERIRIEDKALLNALMFDKEGENLKVPAWSGTFLRHIDLSEVDFENVQFAFLQEGQIDYSYTNIRPDFSKLHGVKKYNQIHIEDVSFEGVDLSGANIKQHFGGTNVNLNDTNIKFDLEAGFDIDNSSLRNVDLSGICFYGIDMFYTADGPSLTLLRGTERTLQEVSAQDPKFQLTGFKDITGTGVHIDTKYFSSSTSGLRYALKKHLLDGCYVNGVLIDPERRKQKKEEARREYASFYKRQVIEPLKSVDEQINAFQKVKK